MGLRRSGTDKHPGRRQVVSKPPPRPMRYATSRDALIAAGMVALRRGGYHGTGLTQILEATALPKGSFYHHFPNKEAFTLEVIRGFGDAALTQLDRTLAGHPDDPTVGLEQYFLQLCQQYSEEGFALGCLLGTLGQEIGAARPAIARTVRTYLDALHRRFTSAIAEAQNRRLARDDFAAQILADWLANGWHGALIRMKVEGSDGSVRSYLGSFFQFLRSNV